MVVFFFFLRDMAFYNGFNRKDVIIWLLGFHDIFT